MPESNISYLLASAAALAAGVAILGQSRHQANEPPIASNWRPVLGHAHHFLKKNGAMALGPSMFEGHGPDVFVVEASLLGQRVYVARGPKAVKLIMGNSAIRTRILLPDESLDRMESNRIGILFNHDLESWKVNRKCFVESVGRPRFLKGLAPKIDELMSTLVQSLDEIADKGNPVLINEMMNLISMDCIMDVLFTEKRVFDAGEFYGKVPPLLFKTVLRNEDAKHRALSQKYNAYVRELVRAKKAEMENAIPDEMDFATSAFMAAESCFEDPETIFKQVNAIVKETIGGGTDTASNSMAFLVYELARHQEIADVICEEVIAVAGWNGPIRHEMLNQLPMLEAALLEVSRIYTLFAAGTTRHITEDVLIDGVLLKKDSMMFLVIGMAHWDASYWENPSEFDPTRFLEKPAKSEGPHGFGWNLSPFGYGVRKCPGQELALLEMKVVMANLCRRYRFRLADPKK
ncbi:cytochrome P450, partial [Rhizoclosmatium globosum]